MSDMIRCDGFETHGKERSMHTFSPGQTHCILCEEAAT
jgi:hypothetical protein